MYLSLLTESVGGDSDFIKEMIDLFVTQADEQITELEDLCIDGDSEDWVEFSHALQGTAAGVGAISMKNSSAKAQDMLSASAADRQKMVAELKAEYNAAILYFTKEGWL